MEGWTWLVKGFAVYWSAMFVLRVAAGGVEFARRRFETEQEQEREELARQVREAELKKRGKEDIPTAQRADKLAGEARGLSL